MELKKMFLLVNYNTLTDCETSERFTNKKQAIKKARKTANRWNKTAVYLYDYKNNYSMCIYSSI